MNKLLVPVLTESLAPNLQLSHSGRLSFQMQNWWTRQQIAKNDKSLEIGTGLTCRFQRFLLGHPYAVNPCRVLDETLREMKG